MKRLLWAFVWVAAGSILTGSPSAFPEQKVYVNGIDPNFPPFAYVDENGLPDGFDVKAVEWIAREMGFKVEHQALDWDAMIAGLIEKNIDLIAAGMSATDKRKEQVSFTITYWTIEQFLLTKRDSRLSVADILSRGNKIGVQRGTTEAEWIEEKLPKKVRSNFTLIYYDSVPLIIEDVVKGRIVAAAMSDALAKDALKRKHVRIAGTFGMPSEKLAYAVRKEDTVLLCKLNKGLKLLMASPYWVELKKKYELE
jgi:polar amino acid transport system substrate-binding protein